MQTDSNEVIVYIQKDYLIGKIIDSESLQFDKGFTYHLLDKGITTFEYKEIGRLSHITQETKFSSIATPIVTITPISNE